MNPSTMVYYMAERTNRERLDTEASRGWLATQAAEHNKNRHSIGLKAIARRTMTLFSRGTATEQTVTTALPVNAPIPKLEPIR
jgi:hypothetical protein